MRPHEKLEVWKQAVEFVVMIYDLTKTFPPDERFGLTSQIRRASVSIPANTAEGAARQTDKEFLQFLAIAQGSCSEVETELLIALKLGYIKEEEYNKSRSATGDIGKMLVGLSRYLRNKAQ